MLHINLEETDSTNSYVAREAANLQSPTMVTAERQTAGRGQRGNTWESEPGENLTFSIFYRPSQLHPREQFMLSEAVALAIADALAVFHIHAEVKWPNDIYVGDRKICGILIEHSLFGASISHSIIGAGLNVNQTLFVSDAPNPVSMAQLSDMQFDLEKVRCAVADAMERRLRQLETRDFDHLHTDYINRLWRREGYHHFIEAASGARFSARIHSIARDGMLTLKQKNGVSRSFAFKEVGFVI